MDQEIEIVIDQKEINFNIKPQTVCMYKQFVYDQLIIYKPAFNFFCDTLAKE